MTTKKVGKTQWNRILNGEEAGMRKTSKQTRQTTSPTQKIGKCAYAQRTHKYLEQHSLNARHGTVTCMEGRAAASRAAEAGILVREERDMTASFGAWALRTNSVVRERQMGQERKEDSPASVEAGRNFAADNRTDWRHHTETARTSWGAAELRRTQAC